MAKALMRNINFEQEASIAARPQAAAYYLFVIAIDRYEDASYYTNIGTEFIKKEGAPTWGPTAKNLQNPVQDAARLVEVLTEKYTFQLTEASAFRVVQTGGKEVKEYNSLNVKCLYNESATRRNINIHIDKLKNILSENDCLLVYFAGHGIVQTEGEEEVGYFIPFDGITEAYSSHTWASFKTLYNSFSGQQGKCMDLLLVLDCCFAGAAGLGAGTQGSGNFSRWALVSAQEREWATDGDEGGSPFSGALVKVLQENTAPAACIDVEALRDKTKFIFENRDLKLAQQISYERLPTRNGRGEFVFCLRFPDVPPVSALSKSIVAHLNFKKQREALENFYFEGSNKKFVIVSTICENFNLHKLQGKVLLDHLKNITETQLAISATIILNADKVTDNIWEAFARNFNLHNTGDNLKNSCASALVQKLLKEDTADFAEGALIIYFGFNHSVASRSGAIAVFCKELYEEVESIKAGMAEGENAFQTLFVVVADTRKCGQGFLPHHELKSIVGTGPKIIVTDNVESIRVGNALFWYKMSKEDIKSLNFKSLSVEGFFKQQQFYDIENFILDVARQLKVKEDDVEKLAMELWHF